RDAATNAGGPTGSGLHDVAQSEQDHERADGQPHLLPREVEERRTWFVTPDQDEQRLNTDRDAEQRDQRRGREQPAAPNRDVDASRERVERQERSEQCRQPRERKDQPPRFGSFDEVPGYRWTG